MAQVSAAKSKKTASPKRSPEQLAEAAASAFAAEHDIPTSHHGAFARGCREIELHLGLEPGKAVEGMKQITEKEPERDVFTYSDRFHVITMNIRYPSMRGKTRDPGTVRFHGSGMQTFQHPGGEMGKDFVF